MAVKVGNSWVSEAALTYAKAKAASGESATLKDLSKRYPSVNFSMNTQPFSQKGTNNIQIAPNILAQMQSDPEKRVEYEALIYDCAQLISNGSMAQASPGFHVKASGTIINADGSVGGWSITESDDGDQFRNKTKLDKDKKDSWTDKILAMHKEKRIKEKQEKKRLEQQKSDQKNTYGDLLFLSKAGLESARQLFEKK